MGLARKVESPLPIHDRHIDLTDVCYTAMYTYVILSTRVCFPGRHLLSVPCIPNSGRYNIDKYLPNYFFFSSSSYFF